MSVWRQGDIIKVALDPTKGHEQAGYRPVLVIQNDYLTKAIKSVVVVLPITNASADMPYQVPLDERTITTGKVLCRHIRAVDLDKRSTRFVEKLPYDILVKCLKCVGEILEPMNIQEYSE